MDGVYQILCFQELCWAEPSFINIIFFLATTDVLKEIINILSSLLIEIL